MCSINSKTVFIFIINLLVVLGSPGPIQTFKIFPFGFKISLLP